MLNGDIPLTSTAVAVTGIIGANVNKELLYLLGIHQSVARGISAGARYVFWLVSNVVQKMNR